MSPVWLIGVTVKRGGGAVFCAPAATTPALPATPNRHARIAPIPKIRRTGFLLALRVSGSEEAGETTPTTRVRFLVQPLLMAALLLRGRPRDLCMASKRDGPRCLP